MNGMAITKTALIQLIAGNEGKYFLYYDHFIELSASISSDNSRINSLHFILWNFRFMKIFVNLRLAFLTED